MTTRLLSALLLSAILLASPASAQQTTRQVSLPNQDYTESTVDLAVKVLGGVVEIRRTWTWGRWYLNDKWSDLELQPDALGGVKSISRAGRVYSRQSQALGGAYSFDERNFIRATESGWQWYDPFGNSIDYDKDGRALGWSNAAGVRNSLVRDDEGRILGVKDHHGRQRLSIEYEGLLPVRVSDTAGRSVSYRWRGQGSATPGSNGSIGLAQLEQVTDVRGGTWHYSYTQAGYIAGRTDPAGAQIAISYLTQPQRKLSAVSSSTKQGQQAISTATATTKVQLPAAIRVDSITDETGAVTRWRVDYERVKRRYHVSIEHPGGGQQILSYDHRGRLIRNTLGGLSVYSIERISDSQDKATDARGLTTITHYNSARQATRIIHPDGSSEESQYNHAGRKTAHRSASGTQSTWRYDARGNETEHIEAQGAPEQRTTRSTYDEWGQKTSATTGAGDGKGADAATERFTYDTNGNITAHTDAAGHTTHYTHNNQGQILTETDPLGNTTSYQYDAAGNLLKVTDALGNATSTQYDGLGRVTAITSAEGRTLTVRRDSAGRPLAISAGQDSISLTYNTLGLPEAISQPAGGAWQASYDKMGRIASLTDPAGNAIRYEYGEADSPLAGLLTKIHWPTYSESYQYDQRSRQTAVTQHLGEQGKEGEERTQSQRRSYGADGQLLASFDAEENATLYSYDALGRLTKTTDPLGGETIQTWDAKDNLLTLTDAEGNTHRFEYDAAGRLTKETRPLGGSTTYEWDAAGRLIKRTDAEGATRIYTWDAAGRLIKEEHKAAGQTAQGTLEQSITYTYDKDGLLSAYQQTDAQGNLISSASYQRDSQGRITSTDTTYAKAGGAPLSFHTEQGHTADGQPASLTYPDGSQQSYTYSQGQLASITTPANEAITYSSYNWLAPRLITMPGASTGIVWDALLRPRHQSTNADGNVLASRSYDYNQLGNITTIAGDSGSTSYAYDKLGRLTDAAPNDKHKLLGLPEEKYLYDKVGNRTASGHQNGLWNYNEDNQLTSYPRYFTTLADGNVMNEDIAVSYTATGHTKEEKGLNWQRQYSYNAAERLSKVEDNRSGASASYRYDPFGRRISKTITQGKVSTTTYYIYGEHGLMAEADETGKLTKAYGFHPDAQSSGLWSTNPVWQADVKNGKLTDEQTQWHYLHTDHLGTPFMATNKQGQRTWRAYQQAFGEAVIDKDATTTVNLRFPGQYFDEETGTHYNFQRDYSPYTGRYLQADPIGLNGGLNLYRYAYNSPLMYMDPEGEIVWMPIIFAVFSTVASVADAYWQEPCATSFGDFLGSTAFWASFAKGLASGAVGGYFMAGAKVVHASSMLAFARGAAESIFADAAGLLAETAVEGKLRFLNGTSAFHASSGGFAAWFDHSVNETAINNKIAARNIYKAQHVGIERINLDSGYARINGGTLIKRPSPPKLPSFWLSNAMNFANAAFDPGLAYIGRSCRCH